MLTMIEMTSLISLLVTLLTLDESIANSSHGFGRG
jgi:hypothetical protein